MSGNGFDNAHNNQFGGGERGPTGGVNMGGGSSGNAGNGPGHWQVVSMGPAAIFKDGEWHINIAPKLAWVNDGASWNAGGGSGGSGKVLNNQVAKIPAGYLSAIDGYVYTITVDGNHKITGISLYSKPVSGGDRSSWAHSEQVRKDKAAALVQQKLNADQAARAEAQRKVQEQAAAAAARRKAEEEARRR